MQAIRKTRPEAMGAHFMAISRGIDRQHRLVE
jgi:hypothetical protein